MKKWWLHTLACILNGIAVTIVLTAFFYIILTTDNPLDTTYAGTLFFSIGYAIYIFSDIWGVKLYYRVKNTDSLSFTDKQAIRAILFFLGLVQLGMGYIAYFMLHRIVSDILAFQKGFFDFYNTVDFLILIIFTTASIVFIGYFFLLWSINKNEKIKKEEIKNIGENDF